jgi:hypothetical protein
LERSGIWVVRGEGIDLEGIVVEAIVLSWEWLIGDRLVIVVLDVDVDIDICGVGRDKN